SSKDFAKAFMARHDIPTAPYRTFTDATQAHAYVDAHGTPVVVKADGLAAGKGVVVAPDAASAHHAIDAMLGAGAFGTAGARVVIEDFLDGEEASFIVMSDGRHVLALASSQDHKRLADGDRGPNTGGMGAYSPAPVVTPTVHARIMREVIAPTIEGMRAEGTPYRGFLYAGVMIDAAGIPRVLEFNCRLGDPEAQPILMRLRSDLVVLVEHALAGTLDRVDADWDRRPALTVVLAAHGYPDAPRRGDLIEGLERVNRDTHPDVSVFHAGTARDTEGVKATGGRVLGVTALGDSLRQAQRAAYAAIASIRFDGMQYRSDIGHRALARRGNAS
ncbi:MAG TPA: phosphoribosylamine--glycine ligase, partial [Casimicrobiaceae bacterium]